MFMTSLHGVSRERQQLLLLQRQQAVNQQVVAHAAMFRAPPSRRSHVPDADGCGCVACCAYGVTVATVPALEERMIPTAATIRKGGVGGGDADQILQQAF